LALCFLHPSTSMALNIPYSALIHLLDILTFIFSHIPSPILLPPMCCLGAVRHRANGSRPARRACGSSRAGNGRKGDCRTFGERVPCACGRTDAGTPAQGCHVESGRTRAACRHTLPRHCHTLAERNRREPRPDSG